MQNKLARMLGLLLVLVRVHVAMTADTCNSIAQTDKTVNHVRAPG
jgi:hypothetical protein